MDLISFCKDYKNNAETLRLSQERELNLKEIINNPMNNQKEKDEKELRNPKDSSIMTGCIVIKFDNDTNQYSYKYNEECK